MLIDKIRQQIKEAMKARNEVRLSTLKLLSAALTSAEIAKKREKLTEEEEIAVVKKEAKKRHDAIELYEKGGAKDRADRERAELSILKEFMPEELSDEKLTTIIDRVIESVNPSGMQDFGKVMGAVMGRVKGQADGKKAAAIVKEKLK